MLWKWEGESWIRCGPWWAASEVLPKRYLVVADCLWLRKNISGNCVSNSIPPTDCAFTVIKHKEKQQHQHKNAVYIPPPQHTQVDQPEEISLLEETWISENKTIYKFTDFVLMFTITLLTESEYCIWINQHTKWKGTNIYQRKM